MNPRISRDRVHGLLSLRGGKLYNDRGEEVVLAGAALGNWLLLEGYMWQLGGVYDRSLTIRRLVRDLAGTGFAETFWPKYYENFVADEDFRRIAELGFNSVRIPINWRVVMKDEPGIEFDEDGMALVRRAVDSCRRHGLYAVLDLHGAPGGQTGSNIDDSVDDMPRLFLDAESREKCLALWTELARRYRDDDTVAAYDLLNEPLRTHRDHVPDVDYLHPELCRFYDDCVAAIRAVDPRHLISLEGAHWATMLETFHKSYGPGCILHFHRYGCRPDESEFLPYLETARKHGMGAWLGESGENDPEWFAAMFPMSVHMGCGFNFWTWKKMSGADNSVLNMTPPDGWDEIRAYVRHGARPTTARARQIFTAYLEACKAENTRFAKLVPDSIFRRGSFTVQATDFDPGEGRCRATAPEGNLYNFRAGSGMRITTRRDKAFAERRFFFDCGWKGLCLVPSPGDWADYQYNGARGSLRVTLRGDGLSAGASVGLAVVPEDAGAAPETAPAATLDLPEGAFEVSTDLPAAGDLRLRVLALAGRFELHSITFGEIPTGRAPSVS